MFLTTKLELRKKEKKATRKRAHIAACNGMRKSKKKAMRCNIRGVIAFFLVAEIALNALNDKPKKILLFPARRKTVNLMEMFKTRNMILDGAKAATNMSKIRDIT